MLDVPPRLLVFAAAALVGGASAAVAMPAYAQATTAQRMLSQSARADADAEARADESSSHAGSRARATDPDDSVVLEVAPDSPQASMRRFLAHARAGRYTQAAEYLDVGRRVNAITAARKLVAVLDRHVWIDLDRLSPESLGDKDDGQPRGLDAIGTIDSTRGAEPIRIARSMTSHGPRWRFTRTTCERIESWYQNLDGRWLLDRVPVQLRHDGPFHIQTWQWMGLGIALIASLILGVVLGRLTQLALGRVAKRTPASWDGPLVVALGLPIRLGWALAVFALGLPYLALVKPAEHLIVKLQNLALVLVFLVACIRAVGSVADSLSSSDWGRTNPSSRSLVGLSARSAHLAAFIIAVLITLTTLGYDVTGVLAGLGVGGIVLALAAQKTVENLLGAFAIGIDQPLREGDLVAIGGITGTVEKVGLRSTRVRTVDRHVVSFPNGKLADTPIESMTPRDRMRLATTITVQHGTDVAKLREARDALEAVANEHEKVIKEETVVRFAGIGSASFDFEVVVWVDTTDYAEFAKTREAVLLGFLEAVAKVGVALAAPVRMVGVSGSGEPDAPAR